MVFRPSGRIPDVAFNLNGENIEIVKSYKYLGLTFSSNGSFNYGIAEMSQKGQKAWYLLHSRIPIDTLNNAKLYLKLFDAMIQPIITYGCEIWSQQ